MGRSACALVGVLDGHVVNLERSEGRFISKAYDHRLETPRMRCQVGTDERLKDVLTFFWHVIGSESAKADLRLRADGWSIFASTIFLFTRQPSTTRHLHLCGFAIFRHYRKYRTDISFRSVPAAARTHPTWTGTEGMFAPTADM